eukprot:6906860-Pyramimonas_sp.AAC.1
MADTLAQRGAEGSMKYIRDEVKQLLEVETLMMRAQRRGAAIIHEICKDADPTKMDRPKQDPRKTAQVRREQRRHLVSCLATA